MIQSSLRRAWLRFAALLVLCPVLARAQPDGESHLVRQLETVLAEEGLVGLAWVLVDGSQVRLGSAGLRDQETGAPFTDATRFHVGSVTKAVLATGVLRLAAEGRLELDAPVSRYLPALPLVNRWAENSPVTVRHLLDHTAGLDDARLWQMFSLRSSPDAPLTKAFPDPVRQLEVRAPPGSRVSYSNSGYTLLAMVVEAATGARYEQVLESLLLRPLGMNDSTFAFTTQVGPDADSNLAWGHVDDGSRYPAQPIFLRPAGQFTTTAGDLGRFLRYLLGDGTLDGAPFVPKGLHASRGRPTSTEASRAGLRAGYGLGLARRDRHGVVGFCHPGNIVGFTAMLCLFPEEGKAFAYSVNTDSETAAYGRIDALLIDALGVAPAAAPDTREPATPLADWAGAYVLRPNRFASFAYLDEVFGAVRLTPDDGELALDPVQGMPRRLRPVGRDLFSASDRATASHVLLQTEDGRRVLSDGFQSYERVSTASRVLHWSSLGLGLAGLAWLLGAGLVSLRPGLRASPCPERAGAAGILALVVPVPFFYRQPFMALGDLTLASGLLALATALVPLGAALAGWRSWRQGKRAADRVNVLAALAVLQWSAVLAAGGLLPLRLWG